MISKSYIAENDDNFFINNNKVLIYGENYGLINIFKLKLKKTFKKNYILSLSQEEIIRDESLLVNEITNDSLFGDIKIIIIENTNDKILPLIESVSKYSSNNKIILISGILEKKSKLRNLFEKDKDKIIIPCYKDNDLTIKNIITSSLREYSGLTAQIINTIHKNSSNDRIKLNNEILKIKTFFTDKQIKLNQLQKLLNLKEEEDFDLLRDASLSGENLKTNELLNSDILEKESMHFYIASINQRLNRLKELDDKNPQEGIDNLKPPIFWKDKPNFLRQSKIWNNKKLNLALTKIYDVEIKIKSNSNLNKETIFKKFLIDICNLANAA